MMSRLQEWSSVISLRRMYQKISLQCFIIGRDIFDHTHFDWFEQRNNFVNYQYSVSTLWAVNLVLDFDLNFWPSQTVQDYYKNW